MANVRFLIGVWRMNLKAAVSLRGAFLLQTFMMFVNNLLYHALVGAVRRFEQIRGWRMADMLLLYGLVAASFGLAVVAGGGVRELGRVILDGGLGSYLTQPRRAGLGSHVATLGLRLRRPGERRRADRPFGQGHLRDGSARARSRCFRGAGLRLHRGHLPGCRVLAR